MESIDRRKILRIAYSAAVPLAAGVALATPLFLRYSRRTAVINKMTQLATTATNPKNESEVREIPQAAFERIRPIFDHLCLNSRHFVNMICASDFAARLQAIETIEARQAAVVEVFNRELASTDTIMDRVREIATGLDQRLDQNWKTCCKAICVAWQTSLPQVTHEFTDDNLLAATQGRIQARLDRLCTVIGRDLPKYQQTIDTQSIGRCALLALKMSWTSYGSPAFSFVCAGLTVLALKIVEWISDRRAELQELVSKELAAAGLSIAREFRQEIKQRVEGLHTWQCEAIQEVIQQRASQAIPLWSNSQ